MGISLGFGLGLGIGSSRAGPFIPANAETVAYIAAASPAPTIGQRMALDSAITLMKSVGSLWSKVSAGYIWPCGVANMKSPGTNDASSTGSQQATHIATDGVGTFITLPNPTTLSGYGQDSAHFFFRRINTGQEAVRTNGWYDGTDGIGITARTTADAFAYRIHSVSASSAVNLQSVPSGDSFVGANRSGAAATEFYIDGIAQAVANSNRASVALNNSPLYLGRGSASEYFAGQYFSCFMGASLTAVEAAGLAAAERIIYKAFTGLDFVSGQVSPLSRQQVPDGLGCDVGKGFTNTGLSKSPNGPYMWMGNHGRPTQASAATFAPSIIRTDMTGAIKLAEINPLPAFPGVTSIQGVEEMPNGNLVFSSQGEGQVRFMDQNGNAVAGSFAAAGVNGLALDTPNNKMFLCTTTTVIRCNMDGTGTEVIINGTGIDLDHLHYVPSRKWLLVSARDNGLFGVVLALDVTTPTSPVVVRQWVVNTALAIEGIHLDPATGVLSVNSDGYFHAAGNQLNELQKYQL